MCVDQTVVSWISTNKISETIPMPERRKPRGLTTGDYLRIASAGLDILGAPSEGPDFRGALATAARPLSKLGVDHRIVD